MIAWLLVVLFFVLWLTKKPSSSADSETSIEKEKSAYWQGYAYLAAKIRSATKSKEHISAKDLEKLLTVELEETLSDEENLELIEQGEIDVSAPLLSIAEKTSVHSSTVDATEGDSAHTPTTAPVDKTIRNLNTVLYTASFLLTASAAAFIAASMPANIKLAGLLCIVALFYGAGLVLYKRTSRLRPAALAFVGTGLAILPFVGISLHLLGGISISASWIIISVIGVVAYFYATISLKSQVVAYLTMAFVLSLSSSIVSSVPIGFVWYFVVLILVSVIANTFSYLKPRWIPKLFSEPIESTGQLVTPLVLLASLTLYTRLSLPMYELVFTVATLHYVIVWLQQRTIFYETIVRMGAHISFILFAAAIGITDIRVFGAIWLLLSVLQATYSLVRIRKELSAPDKFREYTWLGVMMICMLIGTAFWQSYDNAALLTVFILMTFGIISLVAAYRFRSAYWAYPGLAVSLIIPQVFSFSVLWPALSYQAVALFYSVIAGIVLLGLAQIKNGSSVQVRTFLTVAFSAYLLSSLVLGGLSLDMFFIGIVLTIATLYIGVLSYIRSEVWIEIISALTLILATTNFLLNASLRTGLLVFALCTISAAFLYAISYLHHIFLEAERRNNIFALAQVCIGGLVTAVVFNEQDSLTASFVIILIVTLASVAGRYYLKKVQRSAFLQTVLSTSSYIFPALLWAIGFRLGDWWLFTAYIVGFFSYWIVSHVEKWKAVIIVGNLSLIGATATALSLTHTDPYWRLFYIVWISAALLYGSYLFYVSRHDSERQWYQLATIWSMCAVPIMVYCFGSLEHRVAAAVVLLIGGLILCIHGYLLERKGIMEGSLYVLTLSLQWFVSLIFPDTSFVLYAHWWGIELIAVAAVLGSSTKTRTVIGMSIISFFTGTYALTSGASYELLFLIDHVIYMVVGAIKQKSWAIWWGLIATILAVLYFLKDYLYLWLGFLGLFLIGIVVWRLIRLNNKDASTADTQTTRTKL